MTLPRLLFAAVAVLALGLALEQWWHRRAIVARMERREAERRVG